jgi:hypothetical protein
MTRFERVGTMILLGIVAASLLAYPVLRAPERKVMGSGPIGRTNQVNNLSESTEQGPEA